jgi:hypothetical protein
MRLRSSVVAARFSHAFARRYGNVVFGCTFWVYISPRRVKARPLEMTERLSPDRCHHPLCRPEEKSESGSQGREILAI